MKEANKFNIPELSSSKRKNRKKRKARGENVIGWEKLRERWPDAPVSIDGVGLVSAHTSYTGSPAEISGAAKELQTQEIIPKRFVKKRRRNIVLDGEEVNTELFNPPPTPAGHTVTAFGGGIIPGITNGGVNKYPLTGKALPRIGRRIANNAKITGDQNPSTRVDANNNGMIFDGTAREMPDPTPGNSITGQMGLIDKFKKNKPNEVAPKNYTPKTNNTPFGGLDNLISEQAEQVKKFENWASAKDWKKFHHEHFDWWTFPIDRGSAGYGFRYDINGQPLEDLKQKPEYLKSLARATDLYMQSMAWDLKKRNWIDNPDFDGGQDPTNNINGPRLFKIARSLQIHGLNDEFNSVREMAHSLRDGGYRIGNDIFWNDPENYNRRSSHIKNGGITGSMATGLGINPTTFKKSIDGKPRYDTSKEPWFIGKWIKRDTENHDFFTKGKKSQNSALTFWWKDDSTRLDYIDKHKRGRLTDGFADFAGHQYDNRRTGMGFSPRLDKLSKQIEQLGLMWGTTGGTHGGMYDQYGSVFTHSGSSSNAEVSAANQARDLLGHFSKEINPSQYWDRYWSWINNPYVTAKDKNGKEVGVRLAFDDDKDKLVQEFDKRIKKLEDDIRSSYGLKPVERAVSSQLQESDDYSKIPDYVIKNVLDNLDNKNNHKISDVTTIKHLTEELRDSVANTLSNPEQLTIPMVQKLLENERKGFLEKKIKQNPDFLKPDIIDSVSSNVARDIRETAEIQAHIDMDAGKDPSDLDIDKFAKIQFPGIDIEVIKKIYKQELERLLNSE